MLRHKTHWRLGKPGWTAHWLTPYSIHPQYELATPGRIALWKDAGYAVYVWTVNDRATFDKLSAVDGVITDVPEILSQ